MAGRGPRAKGAGDAAGAEERGGHAALDRALVRVCDLAGRPRGTGFAADEHGTVITSHEAVDGLARIVLHASDERTCVVPADAVVALPDADLALVHTEGLGLRPLPLAVRDSVATGAYVRIAALGWREARVLGSSPVTYTATDRFHLVGTALELAIGTEGADALRLGGGAAGGPVVDVASGAVLAVLGTALLPQHPARAGEGASFAGAGSSVAGAGLVGEGSFFVGEVPFAHRPPGFAIPLREAAAADPGGPLAALIARNAATVPAYGDDLNLAGALHLTATSAGCDGPGAAQLDPVERPDVAGEFSAFVDGPAYVLGLVGDPGTGRTTELSALAARRARGAEPAPTLWLRGADLRGTDDSVADAVERALDRAGRILAASEEMPRGQQPGQQPEPGPGLGDISAGRVARLVRDAGRPLLLLLDGPEEMPPALAHGLARWSEGTAAWLRETGARLVVACRAEYWEQAGAFFEAGALHGALGTALGPHETAYPPCVRLDDLPEPQAGWARARYGIPEGALAAADARHPLALRLLSEVRAARPDAPPPGTPGREEIFAAHLDLLCLRVAVRLAAANGLRGTAVRRLAAKVSGQVHEAARRCLGPGQGELDRESFEAVFPWGALPGVHGCTGWASAVLTEGLLVPAGSGYRFAHEEVADWIQGTHLDVDGALTSLIHRHRPALRAPTVPEQRRPVRPLPVPRHRIGPVIEALLLLGRQRGPVGLGQRLWELSDAVTEFVGGGSLSGGGCGAGPAAGAEGSGGGERGAVIPAEGRDAEDMAPTEAEGAASGGSGDAVCAGGAITGGGCAESGGGDGGVPAGGGCAACAGGSCPVSAGDGRVACGGGGRAGWAESVAGHCGASAGGGCAACAGGGGAVSAGGNRAAFAEGRDAASAGADCAAPVDGCTESVAGHYGASRGGGSVACAGGGRAASAEDAGAVFGGDAYGAFAGEGCVAPAGGGGEGSVEGGFGVRARGDGAAFDEGVGPACAEGDGEGSAEGWRGARADVSCVASTGGDSTRGNRAEAFAEEEGAAADGRNCPASVGGDRPAPAGGGHAGPVGGSRSAAARDDWVASVGGDCAAPSGGDYAASAGGIHAAPAGGGHAASVGGDRPAPAGGGHVESVGGSRSATARDDYVASVGGDCAAPAGGGRVGSVGGSRSVPARDDYAVPADGDRTPPAAGGHAASVGGSRATPARDDHPATSGGSRPAPAHGNGNLATSPEMGSAPSAGPTPPLPFSAGPEAPPPVPQPPPTTPSTAPPRTPRPRTPRERSRKSPYAARRQAVTV
ncbi:hypothetical protein [Streptomyces sp. WAC 01529]|uniref:hypothetical protein n=1 Tax=Streptomyces sp. WAC 01529 TaxID=2203205 RepID=UPI001F0BF93D|nr:hypothetical protein [Streptomyces sp. WAC 01529]